VLVANINIEIPDEVYKKIKLSAVQADKTVKQFVIERLDDGLRRRRR
jgi:hypothetical protein